MKLIGCLLYPLWLAQELCDWFAKFRRQFVRVPMRRVRCDGGEIEELMSDREQDA